MFSFFRNTHESQKTRLLEFFKKHKGESIPLPMIMDIRPRIAHYTSTIMALRDMGYDISCHAYWSDGVHCSEYTFKGVSVKPREKHIKKSYTKEDIINAFNAGLALEAPNAEAYLTTI